MTSEALTVPELGRELSHRIGRHIAHDGLLLSGSDPVTAAGCFMARINGYSVEQFHRMQQDEAAGVPHSFARLLHDRTLVGVLGAAEEGFVDELRLVVTGNGAVWGTLILLREPGRRQFSPTDAETARRLLPELAVALRTFVTRMRPRPRRLAPVPGVVVVGADDRITAATPTGRDWLRACVPDLTLPDDDALAVTVWNLAFAARLRTPSVISRIPTRQGWIGLHAQLLDDTGTVAITAQPATSAMLLPALAAWYGITPRERAVVERALEGDAVKHIARRLDLSPHTVNDHFKAIYRKLGVHSREELVASLTG